MAELASSSARRSIHPTSLPAARPSSAARTNASWLDFQANACVCMKSSVALRMRNGAMYPASDPVNRSTPPPKTFQNPPLMKFNREMGLATPFQLVMSSHAESKAALTMALDERSSSADSTYFKESRATVVLPVTRASEKLPQLMLNASTKARPAKPAAFSSSATPVFSPFLAAIRRLPDTTSSAM